MKIKNHAWHTKHTQKKARAKLERKKRLVMRSLHTMEENIAEKKYRNAQLRELNKNASFADRIKYLRIMSKIKVNQSLRKMKEVFSSKEANA